MPRSLRHGWAAIAIGVIAALGVGCDTEGDSEPNTPLEQDDSPGGLSENQRQCRIALEELQRQGDELGLSGDENDLSDEEIDAACGS